MNEIEGEHLDETTEITLEMVKKRAVKGVAVLTGRTFLLNAASMIATGFLTVFLGPSEFGIFWIVSAVVNFLAYFSDIGLAAALIQKKENPTDRELKTTFTVQQFLVLTLLFLLFALTPFLKNYYALSREGIILLYALGISLVFSSLKTIPSILLERDLDFSKLVIPQVLENLVYNLVAVYLAWKGFGISSFTYAVLARGVVGLAGIYILKPWFPGFAFDKTSLKKLLSFGVPYQANTFLATIKDDGMTVFLGGVLGTSGVGFLGWAQKWAYMPLRLFMDHVLKVTFPAFSRMQDNLEELKNSVTRSIFFVCLLVFPTTVGLVILAPVIISIIPRYEKWEPALLPLLFISINTLFAAATTQLTNLLNAIGKIRLTFKLMIMWTVLTWLLVPTLAIKFGVNGAAFAYALIGFSSLIAIVLVYSKIKFSINESITKPFIGTLIMGAVLLVVRNVLPVSFVSLLVLVNIGAVIYIVSMFILVGPSIVLDIKKGISNIFKR